MEIRRLEIRRIKEDELGKALTLVWDVFQKDVAPSYTEEGVQEFLKFIDYAHMKDLYTKGDIIFWGAFAEDLAGTMAVRNDGHISLFFVKNEYQGLGIGKALFQMMYNYCVEELKVKKITVNASPDSVMKYIHMGMRQVGREEERCGIRSVPMEMYASSTLVQPVEFRPKKKKNDNKTVKMIVIAVVIAIVLLLGSMIFLGITIFRNLTSVEVKTYNNILEEPYGDSYGDSYGNPYGEYYDEFFDFYEDYNRDYNRDYDGEYPGEYGDDSSVDEDTVL